MARIVVSENIAGAAMTDLRASQDVLFSPSLWNDPPALREALASAEALIVRNQTQVTAELLDHAPQLKVVARAGVGLDNVDTAAASQRGIAVTFTPNENSISVAELVLGLMLTMARRIPAAWQDTRSGNWSRMQFVGDELYGKTLGLVGFGRIGRLVAERARAFGMTVVAHDEYLDHSAPVLSELSTTLVTFDKLLEVADYVSVHVPLTEQTRGLFNDECFSKMKPGARFINSSRGEVVVEAALLQALEEQRLAGAALDVRETEPPAASRLTEHSNVIVTPHIGAFTQEAQERVVEAVCEDVIAVLNGERPQNPAPKL